MFGSNRRLPPLARPDRMGPTPPESLDGHVMTSRRRSALELDREPKFLEKLALGRQTREAKLRLLGEAMVERLRRELQDDLFVRELEASERRQIAMEAHRERTRQLTDRVIENSLHDIRQATEKGLDHIEEIALAAERRHRRNRERYEQGLWSLETMNAAERRTEDTLIGLEDVIRDLMTALIDGMRRNAVTTVSVPMSDLGRRDG